MIDNLFLSVGAMKAGTTWLYAQLRDHPDIYFTPEKEIHYFANKAGIEKQLDLKFRVLKLKECLEKYHACNLKHIQNNIDEIKWYVNYSSAREIDNAWFENLFSLKGNEKYCSDFSNLYCQMDNKGWDNVRKVAKNVKVIYTLRDPLARLWSHYKFHMKWVNREDEAIDVGFAHFKDLIDKHWFWINAEYCKNYNLLKNNLSDNELLLLYFEDFRANPSKMLAKTQKFLDIGQIEPKDNGLDQKINKTKDFLIPDEWLDHMKNKLEPLSNQMKEKGIWHQEWVEF